jgi:hypothetical protein
MKNLLTQVITLFRGFPNNLLETTFGHDEPVADIYELQINDHENRIAQTIRFSTIKEAMEWAQSRDLLYEPTKAIYLIRVKPTGMNNILRLNICKNVSTEGSSVRRSKTKNKAVLN